MNAGAYGGEMKDVLAEVRTIASDGEFLTHQADTLSLSYRHSALMENGEIVTSVLLSLMPDDPAAIGARMEDYMNRRRKSAAGIPQAPAAFSNGRRGCSRGR